jgi:EmrB/QacA subfamily drug resistance transporter
VGGPLDDFASTVSGAAVLLGDALYENRAADAQVAEFVSSVHGAASELKDAQSELPEVVARAVEVAIAAGKAAIAAAASQAAEAVSQAVLAAGAAAAAAAGASVQVAPPRSRPMPDLGEHFPSVPAARSEAAPTGMPAAVVPEVGTVVARPPVGDDGRPAHYDKRWILLIFLGVAQLMVILDSTIINIALPTAQRALHFSNADRQWVVTAYSLAFGSLLLLGGRISDLIGRKRALIIGLIGFAGASAVGGLATSFVMLVAARAVQGAFAALLAPAVLALMTTTFREVHERGKAFAIYGSIAGAGGAIGLLLGGALTSYASWRWTLFVNLGFAAVAALGAAVILKRDRAADHDPMDIFGLFTATAGLFFIVFGLSHAETTAWTNHYTLGSLGLGAVLLSVFIWWQSRARYPLLPLRVLRNRQRGGSFLAMLFGGAGLFGVFLFLTYYMQGTLGYSAVKTGVAFVPMVAALAVMSQLSSRILLPRYGPRPLVPTGMVILSGCMYMLSRLSLESTYVGHVLPYLILAGFGFGLVITPSVNTATNNVEEHDAGVASATVNTSQQIGGSIGTALLNTLAATALTAYLVGKLPSRANLAGAALHSYTTTFFWSAVIFGVGAVVTAIVFAPKARAHQVQGRRRLNLALVMVLVVELGALGYMGYFYHTTKAGLAVPVRHISAKVVTAKVVTPELTTTPTPALRAIVAGTALSLQDDGYGYGEADPDLTQLGGTASASYYEAYSSTVTPAGGVPAYMYTETADGYWSPDNTWVGSQGSNAVPEVLGPAASWGAGWASTSPTDANSGAEAPGVYLYHGQWVMFFQAARNQGGTSATRTTCIAEATAPAVSGVNAPVTQYTFATLTKNRPLVCQDPFAPTALVDNGDYGGSLDAQPFVDPATGAPYLIWKSQGGAAGSPDPTLWAVALDPATGTTPVGKPWMLMSMGGPEGWKSGVIEAPGMVYSHGNYVLYYAGGDYHNASYGTGYALCDAPAGGFGPGAVCTDQSVAAPLVATGISASTTTGYRELYGPGSATPFTDHWGRDYLAVSAYLTPGASPVQRYLFAVPLGTAP